MTTILAALCFLGGMGMSVLLGLIAGADWKSQRFRLYRTVCAMAIGSGMLMLGIAHGWLTRGLPIQFFVLAILWSAFGAVLAMNIIVTTAALIKK